MRREGSRPAVRTAAGRPPAALPRRLLALAAALALLHLTLPLAWAPRMAPRSYNEGWNAYHAEAVRTDRPLYPEPAALFPNNYPPLSFGLVALATPLFGDAILAGRALSLLAFFAMLAEIGWIAARTTASARLGAFAAVLFAALMAAAFGEYVGTNDPQLVAHAFALGGLALLTGRLGPARLGGAALLLVLSGLVKHNLFALPLAVTVWLFRRDRRAFWTWLAAAGLVGSAALAALAAVHGAAVFASVLGPRTSSLVIAAEVSADWLRSLAAPLAVALLCAREAARDPDGRLFALYAGFSLALGFALTTGEGVSFNAYFELLIALCLLATHGIARVAALLPAGARVIPPAALGLALLVDPLLKAPDALLGMQRRLDELAWLEQETVADAAYLAARPGPAVCESLALCFWAGKPPGVDLFNAQQLFRAGLADEDALLARVADGEFAAVHLFFLSLDREDERVSGQLTRELQLHYVTDRVSANGVFLHPRRGPASRGRR